MKKILPLMIMLLILCPFVFADGMVHVRRDNLWGLQPEKQQLAAINYEDGYENMLISVDMDYNVRGDKAVWLFPVPSPPEKIAIDVMNTFPRLSGNDIDKSSDSVVNTASLIMLGYSTFPFGSGLIIFTTVNKKAVFFGASDSFSQESYPEGVQVYEQIYKMGLTTEIVTAKTEAGLTQYLLNNGMELPQESREIIQEYIGQDYSFVISHITNLEEFKQARLPNPQQRYDSRMPIGIFVKFPTDRIYFPLKPTSVYGSQEIPILLYVRGHVTPNLYSEIEPLSGITYLVHKRFPVSQDLNTFFNGESTIYNLKYTKINIKAPSKYFTDDLWIKDSAPAYASVKYFLMKYPLLWGIILYGIFSVASSLLSGMISFRNPKVSKKRLALHSLWNYLTLIGFTIATIMLKTKKIDEKIEEELKAENERVIVKDSRKVLYVFLFYVFFVVLTLLATLLLTLI